MTENDLLWNLRCQVLRVVDGDTIDCRVELPFGLSVEPAHGFELGRFRLAGINAPEMHGATTNEGQASKNALFFLLTLPQTLTTLGGLPPYRRVYIRSKKPEKYGRWLGLIWLSVDDMIAGDVTKTVNAEMVRQGFAVPYGDEPITI